MIVPLLGVLLMTATVLGAVAAAVIALVKRSAARRP